MHSTLCMTLHKRGWQLSPNTTVAFILPYIPAFSLATVFVNIWFTTETGHSPTTKYDRSMHVGPENGLTSLRYPSLHHGTTHVERQWCAWRVNKQLVNCHFNSAAPGRAKIATQNFLHSCVTFGLTYEPRTSLDHGERSFSYLLAKINNPLLS